MKSIPKKSLVEKLVSIAPVGTLVVSIGLALFTYFFVERKKQEFEEIRIQLEGRKEIASILELMTSLRPHVETVVHIDFVGGRQKLSLTVANKGKHFVQLENAELRKSVVLPGARGAKLVFVQNVVGAAEEGIASRGVAPGSEATYSIGWSPLDNDGTFEEEQFVIRYVLKTDRVVASEAVRQLRQRIDSADLDELMTLNTVATLPLSGRSTRTGSR